MKKETLSIALIILFGVMLALSCGSENTNTNNTNNTGGIATTNTNSGNQNTAVNTTAPTSNTTNLSASTAPRNATAAHWTVTVCRNLTGVPQVTLQAGPGRNDNDVFATWDRTKSQDSFDLPERVQNLGKIYFQANTSVNGDARLCIKHDGVPKKNIKMTKAGNEHHDIDAGDDENDCGC